MPRFRHELKFIIALEDAEQLFDDLTPYCDDDPNVSSLRTYEIASVYYDTKDLRFYYDREESVGYRRKVRLRSYNERDRSKALFLEIKEKHKNSVLKKRIHLTSGRILQAEPEHIRLPLEVVLEELQDTADAREMSYLYKRLELYPVVNIRYHRRPVIPRFEHDMRVTLDTNITAGGGSLPVFDSEREVPIIAPDKGVLEVKTNQAVPLWLNSIMKRYQMTQIRYSKYCLGVDHVFGRGGKQFVPNQVEPETIRERLISLKPVLESVENEEKDQVPEEVPPSKVSAVG